ncbi:hypothetical protein B9Z55_000552 [Caenorhabditis nigoni]|uniref:F-box associated domain-containing protein n=2 Tax=Caenorhabditis nigoni TaxID=1611254 RepID=A0A2G5VTR2_9PELO|nr:hypothetical protein B9Z55_000552 [Caenorhabditis nigoni]
MELLDCHQRLARIPNLEIVYYFTHREVMLSIFKGVKLFVRNAFLDESDVVNFMKKWKSGDGYENLEVVRMTVNNNFHQLFNLNLERSLEAVNGKRFGSTPPVFCFRKRKSVHWYISEQFKSQFYIIRDTDGVVASVSITPESFDFGVWKMTETELLDRMSNGTLEVEPSGIRHPCYYE